MQEVILDSEELRHLEICSDCAALLERFIEYARRELQTEYDKSEDYQDPT